MILLKGHNLKFDLGEHILNTVSLVFGKLWAQQILLNSERVKVETLVDQMWINVQKYIKKIINN